MTLGAGLGRQTALLSALSPAAFACWFSHHQRLLPLRPADFQEMMPAW